MKIYEIVTPQSFDPEDNSDIQPARPRFATRGLRGPIMPGGKGTEGEPHAQYISTMASDKAEDNLEKLLSGPFAKLEKIFGSSIKINDTIPRKGSSREKGTPGSMHFKGSAIDISTRDMDDNVKKRLVAAAIAAGFTGFGFGETFLHLDTGRTRFWAYGNNDFAGLPISKLGAFVKANALSPVASTTEPSKGTAA